MAIGTLTLHRFNGDEAFAVSPATALAMPDGDQVRLNLEIETDERPLKTLPDRQTLAAQPNAEVTIRLPKAELASRVGRRFSVPHSWDEEAEDHVSRFYYCEHEGIDDNVIEFVRASRSSGYEEWSSARPAFERWSVNRLDAVREMQHTSSTVALPSPADRHHSLT